MKATLLVPEPTPLDFEEAGIDVVGKEAIDIVVAGASTQKFFVGPNVSLDRIGFDFTNGFEQRIGGIGDFLGYQYLWMF